MSGSFVAGAGTKPRPPKPACGTTTSALTRGSLRMIGFRLVDLCRRRGTTIARTSAAAGLTLTLAGALAPTATATAPVAGGTGGHSLRSLLNPTGAESHADP